MYGSQKKRCKQYGFFEKEKAIMQRNWLAVISKHSA
jgi:hypothetical protein